jgi:hypothetical protein
MRALQYVSDGERVAYASSVLDPAWLTARAHEVRVGMDADPRLTAAWVALARRMAEPRSHDQWISVVDAACPERLADRPPQPAQLLVPELESLRGEASEEADQDDGHATPDGAWGLVDELVPTGSGHWVYAPYERKLVWQVEAQRCRVIAHAAPTGPIAVYREVTEYNFYEPRLERAWDIDGDGVLEAFWHASFYNEGETDRWSALLTRRAGTIAPWPLPDVGRLVEMSDRTGDGRPDAVYELLVHSTQCASGFGIEHETVEIVAEALPDGSFSLETPAARRHLRSQCPVAPTRLDSPRAVVCARLHGADSANVRRRIQRQYAPFDCAAAVQAPRAHEYFEALLEAAAITVPTLR